MVIVSDAIGVLPPPDLARCQVGTARGRAVGSDSRVAEFVPFETLCSGADDDLRHPHASGAFDAARQIVGRRRVRRMHPNPGWLLAASPTAIRRGDYRVAPTDACWITL